MTHPIARGRKGEVIRDPAQLLAKHSDLLTNDPARINPSHTGSIAVYDNVHLNFICRRLCMFTRLEIVGTKILLNGILSISNATNLAKKMLRGRHFMGANSLSIISYSWYHLVLHGSFDPVCPAPSLPSPFLSHVPLVSPLGHVCTLYCTQSPVCCIISARPTRRRTKGMKM